MRRFVAPGKVVVLGEYAVLDGCPALVAAVEPGVICCVTEAAARITTSPTGDTRFVDAALAAADAPAAHYAFMDQARPALSSKPGLGGSAAASVAAVLAAHTLRGVSCAPDALFKTAFATHHAVQGSGSGVDVAASAWGGMLRFRHGETPSPHPPTDIVVVWSGSSAKTGPRVQTYRRWAARTHFVHAMSEVVQLFPSEPIRALRDGGALLTSMSQQAGIEYQTPALTKIATIASAHGGAAKPSGAGGGDCAIAVLPDEDARKAFQAACDREGFTILATQLAAGARELT